MRATMKHISMTASVAAVVMLGAIACADAPSAVDDASTRDAMHEAMHEAAQAAAKGAGGISGSSPGLVKALHASTARYHATVQATKAGYVQDSPCVAVPGLGGMGYHWVNKGMVDDVFDPTKPEAILYVPDAKGNLKKVAVEFVVLDFGQPKPTFGDHPFDDGGAPIPIPHWTLHVWVDEANPSGVFAPFNPSVACPN